MKTEKKKSVYMYMYIYNVYVRKLMMQYIIVILCKICISLTVSHLLEMVHENVRKSEMTHVLISDKGFLQKKGYLYL